MAKASRKPMKEPNPSRCFVKRERLALVMTLRQPTAKQRALLAANMIRHWPAYTEFADTLSVRQTLTDIGLTWTESKI